MAGAGAFGPYARGSRWIVVIRAEAGGRASSRRFAAEAEAQDFRDEFNRLLVEKRAAARTVGDALDEYEAHLEALAYKQRAETLRRCRAFFAEVEALQLRLLTPQRCERLYDAAVKRPATRWVGSGDSRKLQDLGRPVSATTHRGMLTHAKTFLAWCVTRRWLRGSPLAHVKPQGRLRHGKPQLRMTEARAWSAKALELAPANPGALAAMTALVLGMRASELVSRQVRDLDDGGRLLWIPESKTDAGRRTLEVPVVLRPLLLALAKDRSPTERLFGTDPRGRAHTRGWVLYWTKRVCQEAGVETVCAHSMRGLHATLAIQAGATSQLVASALGHASDAVTLESYAAPGSAEDAKRRKGWRILEGERAPGGLSQGLSPLLRIA